MLDGIAERDVIIVARGAEWLSAQIADCDGFVGFHSIRQVAIRH